MIGYYDRDGNEIDIDRWIQLQHNLIYKMVARAEWGDRLNDPKIAVSTVWLGIDHGFLPDGPPVIFETMVFGGRHDGDCERYCTETEAHMGHARWVERVAQSRVTGRTTDL